MKIVLVGDSIRMHYEPMVRRKVGKRAEVWGPEENCRNSLLHREKLGPWAIESRPDIYQFNCGIHDLIHCPDSAPRVTQREYVRNLKLIVRRLKAETNARLIWATTTPMLTPRDETPKEQCRLDPIVERYNAAALSVMEQNGIEVNDLYRAVLDAGVFECLREDKAHMAPYGNEVLSEAVVRFILG